MSEGILDDGDIGGLATVTTICVCLEMAWCEVYCGGVIAVLTWVEVVLLAEAIGEVGGWLIWVGLLDA